MTAKELEAEILENRKTLAELIVDKEAEKNPDDEEQTDEKNPDDEKQTDEKNPDNPGPPGSPACYENPGEKNPGQENFVERRKFNCIPFFFPFQRRNYRK